MILLYAGWLTLVVLTPFYHPVRPALAAVCTHSSACSLEARSECCVRRSRPLRPEPAADSRLHFARPYWFAYLLAVAFRRIWSLLLADPPMEPGAAGLRSHEPRLPGLLAPTDSLKTAVRLDRA